MALPLKLIFLYATVSRLNPTAKKNRLENSR